MNDNPSIGRFDPGARLQPGHPEFLSRSAQAPPKAPEREIPAVISLLKERLEHLLKTSEHLRDRVSPALAEQPKKGELIGGAAMQTVIGSELQGAAQLASSVAHVLADILDRLQL